MFRHRHYENEQTIVRFVCVESQPTMNYILIFTTGAMLLPNLSPQIDGRVLDPSIGKTITISFNDGLSPGQDVKTILEKSLLNHNPNEITDLALNNVSTDNVFETASFDAFVNLQNLTIVNGKINDFPEATFEGLNSLTFLCLTNNKLTSASANSLRGVPNLRYLYLSNNDLEDLPANVFQNLSKLWGIEVDGNRLKTLPKKIFQLEELFTLSMQNNDITTLEKDMFPAKALTDLHLDLNKVGRIDKNTFENLYNLENITMSGTFTDQVESLPKELFSNSTKLLEIIMNSNRFKSLEAGIFRNQRELKVLDISSNMLTNLPEEMFENNIHLRELRLAKNALQSLGKNIFTKLSELLLLDLSYNKLSHLDAEIFSKLISLSIFNISNNEVNLAEGNSDFSVLKQCLNLTNIQAKNAKISKIFTDWRKNSRLKELDLTSNPLTLSEINAEFEFPISFYFTSNDHTSGQFQVKRKSNLGDQASKVIILDKDPTCESKVDGCLCDVSFFYDLKKVILKCRRFDENKLTMWPEYVKPFVLNDSYDVELILTNCNLISLYPVNKYVKEMKERITKLSFSRNNLNSLKDLEEDLPALKELELDHNNFTNFDQPTFQFLKRSQNLTNVTLHQNPWNCDCYLKDFYNFVKDNEHQIEHKDEITCGNNHGGKSILQFESQEEFCPFDYTFIIILALSFSLLAFFGFALMYYYYTNEKKVKVWMFSKPVLRFLVTEKELDRHKKFDAFISYATPDEWFVEQELQPKLERGERPYKLCIHQRDWHAGDYIPTQIDRSVEESRRTIIVMSPNFLNSFWGKKEFQTAYLKSMQERCSRILIILLENIDKSKLDEEMEAYISTNTYLEWSDPWFWQKLKYALPHTYRIRCKRTREEMLIN